MVRERYKLDLQQTILRRQLANEISRIQGRPIEQKISFGIYSGMNDICKAVQEIDECTSLIDQALKNGHFRKALHEIIVLKTLIDAFECTLDRKNWNSFIYSK